MRRTQIYLSAEQWRELSAKAKAEHASMAELIRRAVDKVYLVKGEENFTAALHGVVGIWADRTDIGTTEKYIRMLRKGKRIERVRLKK